MERADLRSILEGLDGSRFFSRNVSVRVEIPPSEGSYRSFPDSVHPRLIEVLRRRGVERLYSHQLEAYEAASSGRDVVVVTPTASGKTLCYNLPVLNRILEEGSARALYIFPTKALAQDQLQELAELTRGLVHRVTPATYDGDTPGEARRRARSLASVVITNPDMLHTGILPHHTKWMDFFTGLAYVVIDEAHTYRGVFGSHMVNVIRRLLRVCRHYGADPRFICCSATIANPEEMAERLTGREVTLVGRSGAPRGRKVFYFLNPPVVRPETGLRMSALAVARSVAGHLLSRGVSTIVFTRTRQNVEVLTRYLREFVEEQGAGAGERVRGYRGGYLPETRREIERGLRAGEVKGVVSTNALELGVDIGSLEACVLCGYPGSIASTWQQVGRAGRKAGLSCAILVARSTPLDQFVVSHPEYFFERSPESARVNPENLSILIGHLQCAAFELPFEEGESFGEGPPVEEILDFLVEKRVLRRGRGRWYWASVGYPAERIGLRSVGSERFLVVDRSSGNRTVAEVDESSALRTLYPGAIYMVESLQYHVEELDYEGKRAYAVPVEVDYYTVPLEETRLRILEVHRTEEGGGGARFEEGEVHVVSHVGGFKKIKFYTSENIGYASVNLPDREMHTSAFWISVGLDPQAGRALPVQRLLEGLAGVGHAMHHVAALLLMCEPGDLGVCIGDPSLEWFYGPPQGGRAGPGAQAPAWVREPRGEGAGFRPALFLYDAYDGGVGLSRGVFEAREELLRDTLSVIERCPCASGCPSCVGPRLTADKEGKVDAVRLLQWMIACARS